MFECFKSKKSKKKKKSVLKLKQWILLFFIEKATVRLREEGGTRWPLTSMNFVTWCPPVARSPANRTSWPSSEWLCPTWKPWEVLAICYNMKSSYMLKLWYTRAQCYVFSLPSLNDLQCRTVCIQGNFCLRFILTHFAQWSADEVNSKQYLNNCVN